MKIFLLLTISCFLLSPAKAQIVNIPDANFKNALLNHNPVINTNNDGEIQVSEAIAVFGNISVSNKNIFDLTGIEAFVNIQSLYCTNNQLTSLSFSNLTRLTTLDCRSNKLASLNVTNLPALVILTCQVNLLTSLPVNEMPSLKYLTCYSNLIVSLAFNSSYALVDLDCGYNQLTTLSISNVSLLRTLTCNNNQIASLSIGNTPNLQNFTCSNNKLTTLDIANAPLITSLACFNNKLTALTLTGLPALKTINCSNNLLTSITLNHSNTLEQLFCSNNKLTNLSLTGYPFLTRIDCDHNELTSIELNNLPVLDAVYGDHNKLTSTVLNNLPSLRFINFNFSRLATISLNNLPTLRTLELTNNLLTSISLSNLPALTYLICMVNSLTTLDLSQTGITNLHCSDNPDLQYINIKNGKVSLNSNYFFFSPLPGLLSICADDAELASVNGAVNAQLPGQNVVVSSFCNFNPNNYNTIVGELRFDYNSNGCNNLDSTMKHFKINIDDGVDTWSTFTDAQGKYKFFVNRDSNTVTPVFENPYFIITPPTQTLTFTGYGNTQAANFCVTTNGVHPDLEIVLLPVTPARPGFNAQYRIIYRNKGNQVQPGTVTLSYNTAKVNLISSIPATTSQTPGNLTWSFATLSPYESKIIDLVFHVNAPPVVNIGDILPFTAIINPISGDETPADNNSALRQVVIGSYDPNDKLVTEGPEIDISKIGEYLHYIIRFQNTGNAEAINVIIKDSLAANVDWNSIVPVSASHAYRTVITKGNKVEFIFENINLPGMATNEPASHGFVSFKIKPRSTVTVGETISNKAEIYFDYNLPVVTNTVTTTIVTPSQPDNEIDLKVYSNPVRDEIRFTVKAGSTIRAINLYNAIGERLYTELVTSPGTDRSIQAAHLPAGILFLEVITTAGKAVQKITRIR